MRDLEGLEKLVDFVGNKVRLLVTSVFTLSFHIVFYCELSYCSNVVYSCHFNRLDAFSLQEYEDLHVQALQVLSNCLQDVDSMQVTNFSSLRVCLCALKFFELPMGNRLYHCTVHNKLSLKQRLTYTRY